MEFAVIGKPNCELPRIVFQLGNVTWLSAFWASIRKSIFTRSADRNVRLNEAFSRNCDGPVIEFRPAFPQCPAAGATNAAGFSDNPAGASYSGAPV
jgi:hypothetical protein